VKIGLVSSVAPHVLGGGRFIVEWLAPVLREHGHEVEIIYLPFEGGRTTLFDEMLAYRLVDLSETCDQIITFRPPSHLVPHARKVCWFIHHLRGWYDLWETRYRAAPDTPYWRATREALMHADRTSLAEAQRLFVNSRVVGRRVKEFNGLDSELLYPPVRAPERFRHEGYGDEIVCICRFEPHKRQHLLVEAMRHTRTPVRLRLCGAPTPYVADLESRAARIPSGKLAIDARWISEEEKVECLAAALGVAYLPIDEDSYGYPTLEGAHALKPSVVAVDGGGVTEFVRDGQEGLVVEPTPEAIAAALDRLWSDRRLAGRMGEAARARVEELGINWQSVVAKLVA
jgi:glycosyltransferase involved in cell wall biosynthesis